LETKFCQLLGKSSYAFYLLHIGVVQWWLHRHVTPNAVLLLPLLSGLAILGYRYVEVPLHRWLSKQ
jgi:peptidoglycan/LPS O-acetylase OafA/YrhL